MENIKLKKKEKKRRIIETELKTQVVLKKQMITEDIKKFSIEIYVKK